LFCGVPRKRYANVWYGGDAGLSWSLLKKQLSSQKRRSQNHDEGGGDKHNLCTFMIAHVCASIKGRASVFLGVAVKKP
jgi:hypothetical protein